MCDGKDRSMEAAYANKLELVYRAYERSLDLEIAMLVIDLTNEEKKKLSEDEDLKMRIAIYDAHQREDLIDRLRSLISDSESDSVRLAAIKELGKTLYPKRFKNDSVEELNKTLLKVNDNLTANERLKEYNNIVAEANKNKQVT